MPMSCSSAAAAASVPLSPAPGRARIPTAFSPRSVRCCPRVRTSPYPPGPSSPWNSSAPSVCAAAAAVGLTADQATTIRRDAQSVLANYRATIGINNSGRATAGRAYTTGELEALFALSAFADNASLYEQLVRIGGNDDAVTRA